MRRTGGQVYRQGLSKFNLVSCPEGKAAKCAYSLAVYLSLSLSQFPSLSLPSPTQSICGEFAIECQAVGRCLPRTFAESQPKIAKQYYLEIGTALGAPNSVPIFSTLM